MPCTTKFHDGLYGNPTRARVTLRTITCAHATSQSSTLQPAAPNRTQAHQSKQCQAGVDTRVATSCCSLCAARASRCLRISAYVSSCLTAGVVRPCVMSHMHAAAATSPGLRGVMAAAIAALLLRGLTSIETVRIFAQLVFALCGPLHQHKSCRIS